MLCGEDDASRIKTAACREAGYDRLVAAIDEAFDGALARAPANVGPLLRRDEAWFNEMIREASELVQETDERELRDGFSATLRRRAEALGGIALGFGRSGLAGKWTNAFGSLTLAPAATGTYRLDLDMRVNYGSNKHRQCRLSTAVRSGTDAWFTGAIEAEAAATSDTEKKPAPSKSSSIKLRRQGETLRVVLIAGDDARRNELDDCEYLWQTTGSYFASGRSDAADRTDTTFVGPTFDCTRPETATDEEICADPDLAANDHRLNRAWKAVLRRLDVVTRRALTEDQRKWVRTQAWEFPEFLHPAWEKQTSQMHTTADARDHVDGLQRERIALLEGFDDKRTGLAGVWLAHNAIIRIAIDRDGRLEGEGWKWEQGDWKAGCDYDMSGKLVGGVFRSDEQRENPDTLERDHATLIVNRLDDVFAAKRYKDNGVDENTDEAKCKRRLDVSSTARLFPARPSPDIDTLPGSIR